MASLSKGLKSKRNLILLLVAALVVTVLIVLGLLVFLDSSQNAHSPENRDLQGEDLEKTYCETDADCVIKDMRNCCGYNPKCVNKDYPEPDPEEVARECAKSNMTSICGFPAIESCKCENNTCIDVGPVMPM